MTDVFFYLAMVGAYGCAVFLIGARIGRRLQRLQKDTAREPKPSDRIPPHSEAGEAREED